MKEMLARYVSEGCIMVEISCIKETGGEALVLRMGSSREEAGRLVIRRLIGAAAIREQMAQAHNSHEHARPLLLLALDRLKKEGTETVIIKTADFTKKPAMRLGFVRTAEGLRLENLQKREFYTSEPNEKTIAKYSLTGVVYELREKTQKTSRQTQCRAKTETIARLADTRTGLSAAMAKWQTGKEKGCLYDIKAGIESARMAKTVMIYALWRMKQEGAKEALLDFGPETGKEEKAKGLYISLGFRQMPKTSLWALDLDKIKIQKAYLK
jgi:hypothetical protein